MEISRSALLLINDEVAKGGSVLETGGILLGHDNNGVPRVTVAGGPGPSAIREPLRFSRDRRYAEGLAERAWLDSHAVWLGEWHTHPGGGLAPSETDMASYGRHLADPELGFDHFISLIVAVPVASPSAFSQQPGRPVLAAWIVGAYGAQAAQLDNVEETHDG